MCSNLKLKDNMVSNQLLIKGLVCFQVKGALKLGGRLVL